MDLKVTSTDKSITLDINAGLGGLHSIKLECASFPILTVTPQQLIDIVAPSLREYITNANSPASTPSQPSSPESTPPTSS
jgi:hypothetical protein